MQIFSAQTRSQGRQCVYGAVEREGMQGTCEGNNAARVRGIIRKIITKTKQRRPYILILLLLLLLISVHIIMERDGGWW